MTKPTTIEEVLEPFFADGKGVVYSKRLSEAVATIEQLVLERVVGENDELMNVPKGRPVPSFLCERNRLRDEQRQALKQLVGQAGDAD